MAEKDMVGSLMHNEVLGSSWRRSHLLLSVTAAHQQREKRAGSFGGRPFLWSSAVERLNATGRYRRGSVAPSLGEGCGVARRPTLKCPHILYDGPVCNYIPVAARMLLNRETAGHGAVARMHRGASSCGEPSLEAALTGEASPAGTGARMPSSREAPLVRGDPGLNSGRAGWKARTCVLSPGNQAAWKGMCCTASKPCPSADTGHLRQGQQNIAVGCLTMANLQSQKSAVGVAPGLGCQDSKRFITVPIYDGPLPLVWFSGHQEGLTKCPSIA